MKKKIIILILLFVVFVIVMAPAKLVQNFLPSNSAIEIQNMTGTVWSGQAKSATLNDWTVETITYQINFLGLLTATLSGTAEMLKGDVVGDLDFAIVDQNNLSIEQAHLQIEASKLAELIPFPGVELQGVLSTESFAMQVENRKITQMTGVTSWKSANVQVNNQRWNMGEFVIDWVTDSNTQTITGKLRKTKNLLDIEGNMTLSKKGVFEFKGSVSNAIDQNIYAAMTFFADGKPVLGRLPIKFKKKIQ